MKQDQPASAPDAMEDLIHGYEEEMQLYTRMRNLTWKQRAVLRGGESLDRFGDLVEEKRDLLQMITEIETRLRPARSFVLSHKPPECWNRSKLETLLDGLAATIEDICVLERSNAALLRGIFDRPATPVRELVHARS